MLALINCVAFGRRETCESCVLLNELVDPITFIYMQYIITIFRQAKENIGQKLATSY